MSVPQESILSAFGDFARCLLAHGGDGEGLPRMTPVQTIAAVAFCVVVWLALRIGIVRRHLEKHGSDAALPPRAYPWMRRPAIAPATRWILGAAAVGLIALFVLGR